MMINTKVKDEFYVTMTELQAIIIDLNENQASGLEMVQCQGLPLQNQYAPSILLAKIDWEQFAVKEIVELYANGMLLLPTGEDVPTFFWGQITRHYKKLCPRTLF